MARVTRELQILAWSVFLVLGTLAAASAFFMFRPVPLPEEITRAEYDEALRAVQSRMAGDPDHAEVLLAVAETALERDQLDRARACLEEIRPDHPQVGHLAQFRLGQVMLRLDRPRDGERALRAFLKLELRDQQCAPYLQTDARRFLAQLLGMELRLEERKSVLGEMVQRGETNLFETLTYCFPSQARISRTDAAAEIAEYHERRPQDPHAGVALVLYRTWQGRLDEAVALSSALQRLHPDHPRVATARMELARFQDDWSTVARLVAALGPPADSDPWLMLRIRGHHHLRQREWDAAERSFRLALKGDPANYDAHQGLAQLYRELDDDTRRQQIADRLLALARIEAQLGMMDAASGNVEPLLEVVRICREHGWDEQARTIEDLSRRLARHE